MTDGSDHAIAQKGESLDQRDLLWLMKIGSAGVNAGALVGMVGNLLHPATPIGDMEGVARAMPSCCALATFSSSSSRWAPASRAA